MREDDDHIRQFMPVLRRIIIMVAVLTAIPVAMWTITAFVRTYIGPPTAPNYQPTRLTPSVTSDEAVAAPVESAAAPAVQNPNAAPAANVVVARATTTDADANPPAGAPISANPVVTGSAAAPAAPAPAASALPAVATAAPGPSPGPAPAAGQSRAPIVAAQQPAATDWPAPPPAAAQQPAGTNWPTTTPDSADALPAGEPITGKVPLPRKRPRSFVVAQSSIPLPRPRPDDAGPGAPAPSSTPLDWLHNIFQPSAGAAAPAAAAPEDTDGYVETPH